MRQPAHAQDLRSLQSLHLRLLPWPKAQSSKAVTQGQAITRGAGKAALYKLACCAVARP